MNARVAKCRVSPNLESPARTLALAVGSVLLGSAMPAVAADLKYDPKVSVSWEYDDNDRMSSVPGQEIEVYGPRIDASLGILAATPRTQFELTPRVAATAYVEGEEDDVDNYYLDMNVDHVGERLKLLLDARYSSVVTLGRYFPGSGGGDDPLTGNPDPGENVPLVGIKNREDRFWIAPGATFDLTERQSVEVGASYLESDFEDDLPDYEDFKNTSVNGGYRFKISPTGSVALLASYDQYEPVDEDSTDYWSLRGEWTNKWTETTEVYARAGSSFVEDDEGDLNTGFSGGVGVRWEWQVTKLFFDANQYVDPNANGDLITRTQIRGELSRRLSEKILLKFGARYIEDDAPPGGESLGREYWAALVGAQWRFTRTFTAFGGYQYRWKEREGAANSADSNAFSVGVTWAPMRK